MKKAYLSPSIIQETLSVKDTILASTHDLGDGDWGVQDEL